MKTPSFFHYVLRLAVVLGLVGGLFPAQAQNRIELDNLTWFEAGSGNGLPPGTYTKPGSPSETIVSNIPWGGPPAIFCNSVFGSKNNNGQTIISTLPGKGFFQSLNDYGGTYTLTRTYRVTPGKLTYMKVRMGTIAQSWLLPSSISATIDGRSLGRADRSNSNWDNKQFVEGSQTWTPSGSLVNFVISITAPGGCHADEEILYVDAFYQVPSTIIAVDDAGATVDSNGGLSVANVLANDSLNGATPTLATVNLTQVSTTYPGVALNPATGAVVVAPATPGGTYQVVYQICEKTNPTNCSQATATTNVTLAKPLVTINKVLAGGGRLNAADQFKVQLLEFNTVVASGTSRGSGSTIDPGTGTLSYGYVWAESSYRINEVMAADSVSGLGAYSTTYSCKNTGAGGSDVSNVHSPNDYFNVDAGDNIVCTITNSSPGASLAIKQVIAAGSGTPPFTFNYSVNNGWGTTPLTSPATGEPGTTSSPRDLTTAATATTVQVDLPPGWRVVPEASFCTDSNGAVTGNGNSSFGTLAGNVLTVPAANVRPRSALLCTVGLGLAAPTITLAKALGSPRINDKDQFVVQIKQAATVVASGTTSGSGSTVLAGSTGVYGAVANTSYTVTEVMDAASTSGLAQYSSAVACKNNGVGGTAVDKVLALNASFTPQAGDVIVCTITNSIGMATLTVRQLVQSPVPVNLLPPFSFSYTGNNGWSSPPIVNNALNVFNSSNAIPLAATNVATTLSVTLPEPRYFVSGFSCVDSNAAATGNPTGVLVSLKATSITIPAANVRAGSALRCTLLLGHFTP